MTTQPLNSLEIESLIKGDLTPLNSRRLKAVFVEVSGGDPSLDPNLQDTQLLRERNRELTRQWSEHAVPITTAGNGQPVSTVPNLEGMPRIEDVIARPQPVGTPSPTGSRPKRVGVFMGVRNYLEPAIRPLSVADHDAEAFAAAMMQFGKVDEGMVLLNDKATLRNIETVIRQSLPAAIRPGDTVFIYWSGHGGRTSNLMVPSRTATTSIWCLTTGGWNRRPTCVAILAFQVL